MLQAHVLSIVDDQCDRGRPRHQLRLPVQGASGLGCGALIHNLSQTGMLIETADDLAFGEMIHIDLPEAGNRSARVVWHSDRLFGCQFEQPISKGAVSAALLRAPGASGERIVSAPTAFPADPPSPEHDALGPIEPPEPVDTPAQQIAGRVDSAGVTRLPVRTRVLLIAGLSAGCWALLGIPLALIAS